MRGRFHGRVVGLEVRGQAQQPCAVAPSAAQPLSTQGKEVWETKGIRRRRKLQFRRKRVGSLTEPQGLKRSWEVHPGDAVVIGTQPGTPR